MSWISVIVLAVIQGIAEFLPVSSSGHLAVLSSLFGFNAEEGLSLGIILHAGSLLAIICFYFKLLLGFFHKDQFPLLCMVVLGSIPAGIFGVALKLTGAGEKIFHDLSLIGIAFLITGMLLRLTGKEKLTKNSVTGVKEISIRQAILIGLAQMVAVFPGISRSGATICTGIFCGLRREAAAAYSFLLALPAIGGAAFLELLKLLKGGESAAQGPGAPLLLTGLAVSAVTSFGALTLLNKLVIRGKLAVFSWYLFAVGGIVLICEILKTTRVL